MSMECSSGFPLSMLLSRCSRAGDIVLPMDHPVLSQQHSLIHLITAPECNTQALTKLAHSLRWTWYGH